MTGMPLQIGGMHGVRISKLLGLTWEHVEWASKRIMIRWTLRCGEIQKGTKTNASKVPMCRALAVLLAEWRRQTPFN